MPHTCTHATLPKYFAGIVHWRLMYYRSKRYCPVLVAHEGSALWGNTLTTALLHELNRTIPFGTIVLIEM